jgi:hypothetical protein
MSVKTAYSELGLAANILIRSAVMNRGSELNLTTAGLPRI